MASKRTYPRTQNLLLTVLFAGDVAFTYVGLTIGYLARVKSPLREIGVRPDSISFEVYQPLLWVGTAFMVIVFAYLRLYDARILLRPQRAATVIMRGTFFWFLAFLGFSLALKFEPAISRVFVALSTITTATTLILWRYAFYRFLAASTWRERLTQYVVIIGWNEEAERLVQAVDQDSNHPYQIAGIVTTHDEISSARQLMGERLLGPVNDLDRILENNLADIAVVADLELPKEAVMRIASTCERLYIHFKIVPSFFQIFVSNLRMQTISGVPILGVESLAITSLSNQALKRAVDLIGGMFGLMISTPIMVVLTLIIRRESPGPVIYRQIRTGLHGRPFTIYKMRSMKLDAEKSGAQWAVKNDDRRLKIGAFMREWNLDELPQFWNVVKGDMSLVGPRPERPELIKQFEQEIPHYNPRHEVRPGVTGWAQVNGLRGNTSLVERIRYDLYYIENWSVWFDIQIMFMTFFKRENAY